MGYGDMVDGGGVRGKRKGNGESWGEVKEGVGLVREKGY